MRAQYRATANGDLESQRDRDAQAVLDTSRMSIRTAEPSGGSIADYLYVDAEDKNQSRNRRKARGLQRSRWVVQMSVLASAAVVAALPLYFGSDSAGAWIDAAVRLPDQMPAHAVLVPLIETAVFLSLLIYTAAMDHSWYERRKNIVHPLPQSKAVAFMQVMELIERTKFVGLATSVFGLLSALSAAAILAGSRFQDLPADWAHVAQVILGLALTHRGFDIGRRYVQGSFLAQHVMILAEMSGPEKIGYDKARERIHGQVLGLISHRPQWFYFRKRQKHLSTD